MKIRLGNHFSGSPCDAGNERRWLRRPRGFTLIEVLFAVFIFLIMAMMFFSVATAATRASRFGNSYNQAMSLAQHKIDQMQSQGFSKAKNPTGLYGTVLDDPGAVYPQGKSPAPVFDGTLPAPLSKFTGYFTCVDKLDQYFVTSKDGAGNFTAKSAEGKVEIEPYIGDGAAAATNLKVIVTIRWQDAQYAPSEYRTEAVLTNDPTL
ncbi:MAG: prepilin-type N-terminal cleavage/methylation domain-containing protein [Cytophagales bacterium]|nr:prepilin-type N-terminal cleavage/methylation domain-containing protein [Armatimonadota bacterium]